MKLLYYYSQIYIKKNNGYIAEKSYEYDITDLPIEKLYNESIYLSQYLMYRIINSLNKSNVNLNKKCVTILLDCSVYITPIKKITNMIILCAMTMVLYNLRIKYSIGLFGDEDFKIIMKQFDEEHSLLILQQVYECLMLKRYRSNLASVVLFAQKNSQFIGSYNKNKNNFYENHPEQVIYIITDGLDEELTCINEWRKIIRQYNIKYGFIINQPNKIEEMVEKRNIKINVNRWNDDDKSMISNYDIIKEDDISTLYDDNFSILSDDPNFGAHYPNNFNFNNDEENVDENGLRMLLQMWKSFISENSEKLRTTLINSKDGKLDNKSIKILSIDFAYLICNSNYTNNDEEKIIFDYKENKSIYLYDFDFIKNIKYNYNIKEKSYVNSNSLKIKI